MRSCALCATCQAFCCVHRRSKLFVIRRAAHCYSPFPGERSVFIRPRAQHFRCGVMPFVLLRSRSGSQGAESGWVYKTPPPPPPPAPRPDRTRLVPTPRTNRTRRVRIDAPRGAHHPQATPGLQQKTTCWLARTRGRTWAYSNAVHPGYVQILSSPAPSRTAGISLMASRIPGT